MEEELLGSDARHKATVHKPSCPGRCVEGCKAGERLAGDHEGWPLAFQLNLAEQTRDLHSVDSRTLGSRLHHQLQVVLRELVNQPHWQALSGEKNELFV